MYGLYNKYIQSSTFCPNLLTRAMIPIFIFTFRRLTSALSLLSARPCHQRPHVRRPRELLPPRRQPRDDADEHDDPDGGGGVVHRVPGHGRAVGEVEGDGAEGEEEQADGVDGQRDGEREGPWPLEGGQVAGEVGQEAGEEGHGVGEVCCSYVVSRRTDVLYMYCLAGRG